MSEVLPIEQQMEAVERRFGSWDGYLQNFAKLDERQRTIELGIFDQSFNDGMATPTREFASYWNRRRELGHLDSALRKAQR